jgi:glycosyltransferase 2 family protein
MPRNSDKQTLPREAAKSGTRGGWRRWLLAALIVGGLVVGALHWGDVKKFAELTTRAQPAWLGAALLLQVLTYVLLSTQWWLVLRQAGSGRPIVKLLPLTITKLFADQVVPTAGVSGNVLLVDRLRSIGVPREHAMAAIILAIIAYYLSYAAATVIAVAMLALRGKLSLLPLTVAALLLTVATAIPAAILWLRDKGDNALPNWLRRRESVREMFEMVGEAPRELVRDPKLIAELALLNFAVFAADALTLLACLFALGQHAPFDAAFVAFTMAAIVTLLGAVPLGLGSFEATSIATLRLMGVPFEAALSATLLYRGFALWLPLGLGAILTRRAMRR